MARSHETTGRHGTNSLPAGSTAGTAEDADVSAAELTERVMRVAHLIRRSGLATFAALDLTPAQSRALRTIYKSGQPIRMGELAATLGIVPRSATGLVEALQEAGLVDRSVDPANRRSVLVTLTASGRERQRAMSQARAAAGDDLFGALTPDERRMLAALLGRIQPDTGSSGDGAKQEPPTGAVGATPPQPGGR